MRIKKRYIVMVVCWVIFIIVALYLNSRGESKYNFTYMNQAALIIDNNYDGKIELITPNSELSGSEKSEKKTVIANTYVYSSPDSSSSYCGELLKGDEVLVYSSADGWFKISYNGRVAYVLSAAIEAPEEPTTPKPTQRPTQKPTQPPTTKPQPTTPTPTEPTQPSEEPTTPEEPTSGSDEEPTTPEEPTSGSDEEPTTLEESTSGSGEEETSGSGDENPTEAGGEVPSGEPSSSEGASEEESGDGETSGSEDDLMEESFE